MIYCSTDYYFTLQCYDTSICILDPDFVSLYEIHDFVYLFFREVATEFINCGKVNYFFAYVILITPKNSFTRLCSK